MTRTYNTEIPLPEDFEVPDHVPPELVRDYDFLKTFEPNALAEPFSKTARVFEDEDGKMNLDLTAVGGEVLCVSQFTLYGSVRKGRRPSFTGAAEPDRAEALYERFCATVEGEGVRCARGRFGAHMAVESVNDGPVTLLIDSAELERPRRA